MNAACSMIISLGTLFGFLFILIGLFMFALGMKSKATVITHIGGGFGIQAVAYVVPIIVGIIIIFAAFITAIPFCAVS